MSAPVCLRHLRTLIGNALDASAYASVPVVTFPADESYWGAPHVVLKELSGGNDRRLAHAFSLATEATWEVVVVVPGEELTPAIPIARIVHQSIENTTGNNADGQVFWCLRQGPLNLPIKRNGTVYQQLGGIYRLRVRES